MTRPAPAESPNAAAQGSSADPLNIGIVVPSPSGDPSPSLGNPRAVWSYLADTLCSRGHRVEIVEVPIELGTVEVSPVDLASFDVVVSGRSLAGIIEHPCHVLYLFEPPPDRRKEPVSPEEPVSPKEPVNPEEMALSPRVRRVAASSARLAESSGVPADAPLIIARPCTEQIAGLIDAPPQPVPSPPRFVTVADAPRRDEHAGPTGFDLVVEAFGQLDAADATLTVIAPPSGAISAARAADHDQRIEVIAEAGAGQSVADLADRLGGASAAIVANDDSGLFAQAVMAAATPVIATTDATGTAETIEHDQNGWIVDADADALVAAMQHVLADPRRLWLASIDARRSVSMAGLQTLAGEIERLGSKPRPRVLTLSTFSTEPVINGGQRRVRFLQRHLAEHVDLTILVLSAPRGPERAITRRIVETGVTEVLVPRSKTHVETEGHLGRLVANHVDDLVAGTRAVASPDFVAELRHQLDQSDAVILSHPFLATALPDDLAIPVVYDSHNFETGFKQSMLPDSPAAAWLVDQVRQAETQAVARAALVSACTADDLDQLSELAPDAAPESIVIPNGVDGIHLGLRSAQGARRARAELLSRINLPGDDSRPVAVFVASWHPPNLDAADLIIATALRRPDWIFVLAGSHTDGVLRRGVSTAGGYVPANVHLLATFPESWLWVLIAGATVALNPMLWGGGSNLKLFDYLAVGTPIMTTRTGSRGLIGADDVTWQVEATPAHLADTLDRIRQEAWTPDLDLDAPDEPPAGRQRRGRALVDGNADVPGYRWDLLGQRWARAVLSITNQTVPTAADATPTPSDPYLSPSPPPGGATAIDRVDALSQWILSHPQLPKEFPMDPTLRHQIDEAERYRHLNIPTDDQSRLKGAKHLIGRLGIIMLGEQRRYNKAMLDAVRQLTANVEELNASVKELRAQQDEESAG